MVMLVVAAAVAESSLARPRPVPHLQHVVLVVFENHERSSVVGNADAQTFNALANRYAEATRYHAVAHPSLPNYLALISGSTHGVTNDCTTCPQHGPTIGTQLTRAGVDWGAYARGLPLVLELRQETCPVPVFPGGAGHVHPLDALHPSRLPAFSFVVPDLCHDMHDCSIRTGDEWLARFIRPLLTLKRTVVFVVFDEGTTDSGGGGEVPLIAAGTSGPSLTLAPGRRPTTIPYCGRSKMPSVCRPSGTLGRRRH